MKAIFRSGGLTLTILASAAFLISGCSRNSQVTAPVSQDNPAVNSTLQGSGKTAENVGNPAEFNRGDSYMSSDRILTIFATVEMTDVEGGCYFLKTSNGDTYTPVTPKGLKLERGMQLKAEGYVNKDIITICGIGPAFVIQNYEIFDQASEPNEGQFSKR